MLLRFFAAALVFGVVFYAFGFHGPAEATPMAPVGSEGSALLDRNDKVNVRIPYRAELAGLRPQSLGVAEPGLKRPAKGSLMAPLEVLIRTSSFGQRLNPITGQPGEFHWGQDFAAPCGTRVYAADAGVVHAAAWHPWGGGNRVEIDHGNGLITTYNHLLRVGVSRGDKVQVGEIIAKVGTSGSSTGCHLHFEVIANKAHQDPNHWRLLAIRQIARLLNGDRMISFDPSAVQTLGWSIPTMSGSTYSKDPPSPPPPAQDCTATPQPEGCTPPPEDCKAHPQAPSCATSQDTCKASPQPPGCTTPPPDTCKASPQPPDCTSPAGCTVQADGTMPTGCPLPAGCVVQADGTTPTGCPLPPAAGKKVEISSSPPPWNKRAAREPRKLQELISSG